MFGSWGRIAGLTSKKVRPVLIPVYESIADGTGLTIWKLMFLEEVEVDVGEGKEKVKGTRVAERIEGWAPALARPVAQYVC